MSLLYRFVGYSVDIVDDDCSGTVLKKQKISNPGKGKDLVRDFCPGIFVSRTVRIGFSQ